MLSCFFLLKNILVKEVNLKIIIVESRVAEIVGIFFLILIM